MLCNQKPWIELVAFGNGNIKMISNQELYKDFYDLTPNKKTIIETFKKIVGFSIKTEKNAKKFIFHPYLPIALNDRLQ
jgi:hypothetical protein